MDKPHHFHSLAKQALFAIALACGLISTSHADLRLLSEEFPPINFTEQGMPRGLAVEIVQEIQRREGSATAIEFMPWARAFREAKGPGETALFGMARTPEREKQFKWVGPIVTFYSSIYAPAKDGMRLHSMDDAKRASAVLVVRDWFTAEELKTLGFQNLVSVTDPVTAIKMLLAKRVPFFATERLSMPDILAKAGISPNSLEIVYSYASSDGYIAFSLDTPDATVKAWAERLREMKRDGSFLKIYRRWLPKDNPPMGIMP
ncbi:substrate-binding periplasmic protein [Roseateles oligotrophus]|uniref:Transporter substrate-binding domain-containing protein n=1 Tax=Roseateles oligotrophus TaxID=1769250 RepID=A0ABT2YG37_9BURK|nr:transporter substrate-binding domain-containing protein [Roseateles oligotrophus]MCV2369018.1 transporter substrate-binding domain-containing protein [Roseateles oligotrophus]